MTTVVAQTLDPLVERLLWSRALFGLGVVLMVARLASGTSVDSLFNDAFGDSIVMLLSGPIALVLGCLPLVLLARRGTRRQVSRLVARPVLTGLLTFAVFLALMKSDPNAPLDFTLKFLLTTWLLAFTLPTLYLVHRNSFAVQAHPLVRPLVAVLLVWLTVLGHVTLLDTKDTSTHGAALYGLLAGPVGVTATAVIEIVVLRRRHRVGFRGPLPPRG